MNGLLKQILFALLVSAYLFQGVSVTQYAGLPSAAQEQQAEAGGEACYRELTLFGGDALPVSSVQEVRVVPSFYRYIAGNDPETVIQGYERMIIPTYKYVCKEYDRQIAWRQDAGYYVFGLCKIIV